MYFQHVHLLHLFFFFLSFSLSFSFPISQRYIFSFHLQHINPLTFLFIYLFLFNLHPSCVTSGFRVIHFRLADFPSFSLPLRFAFSLDPVFFLYTHAALCQYLSFPPRIHFLLIYTFPQLCNRGHLSCKPRSQVPRALFFLSLNLFFFFHLVSIIYIHFFACICIFYLLF